MIIMLWFFVLMASLAAILFTVVRALYGGVLALVCKAFASFMFVMLAIFAILLSEPPVYVAQLFMVLGLVAGLIGDLVLELKMMYPNQAKSYLNAGIASFSIGHIFFFVGLVGYEPLVWTQYIYMFIIAVILSLVILYASKFIHISFKDVIIQVSLYTFILTFMALFGGFRFINDSKFLLFFIGMVLFLLSDLVLSPIYFGNKKDDKTFAVINHLLYYGAQISIATFIFSL
jgi:hypothetical protein